MLDENHPGTVSEPDDDEEEDDEDAAPLPVAPVAAVPLDESAGAVLDESVDCAGPVLASAVEDDERSSTLVAFDAVEDEEPVPPSEAIETLPIEPGDATKVLESPKTANPVPVELSPPVCPLAVATVEQFGSTPVQPAARSAQRPMHDKRIWRWSQRHCQRLVKCVICTQVGCTCGQTQVRYCKSCR